MGQAATELWKSILRASKSPAAVMRADGDDVELAYANLRFRELCATSAMDATAVFASCRHINPNDTIEMPGQVDWRLSVSDLGDGVHWLLEAARPTPDTTHELVAKWVASATIGRLGVFFLDPSNRLRAFNGGVRYFFPMCEGFPVPGGTFDDQLQAILERYDFKQLGDRKEQWRRELTEVYENPGTSRLGVTPSGLWALATASRMADGSTFIFMHDITEFRERDQQMKLFMRNAEELLFSRRSADTTDLRASVWGKSADALIGAGRQKDGSWLASDFYALVLESDLENYMAHVRKCGSDGDSYSVEFRYRNQQSGKVRWLREHGWRVTDQEGRHFIDALTFDITSTKRANLAMSQSEEKFRHFTDLASDWYMETNPDLSLSFLSERFEHVSQLPNDTLINVPYQAVVEMRVQGLDSKRRQQWFDYHDLLKQREDIREHQLQYINPDGALKTIAMSCEPRYDKDGEFVGYRGIGRDLTDLIDAQEQAMDSLRKAEMANAAKSSFIANVSHELRTPLNAILGFSSIMAEEMMGPLGDERYRSYAQDIQFSGQHLLSLVNDLLDMSRLEAGQFELEETEFDLADEIRQVESLFQSQAEGRTLDFAPARRTLLVRCDQRALRQVLINLLSNAVKFTRDDSRIEVASRTDADGCAVVTVSDNGAGIAASDLEQVFEPFGRAKSEIAAEGTGLGLPLSRNLMRLHDGDLVLESRVGHGTIATMTLPANRVLPSLGRAHSATA